MIPKPYTILLWNSIVLLPLGTSHSEEEVEKANEVEEEEDKTMEKAAEVAKEEKEVDEEELVVYLKEVSPCCILVCFATHGEGECFSWPCQGVSCFLAYWSMSGMKNSPHANWHGINLNALLWVSQGL